MKYLLDTHTWIWWNMNPDRLSKKVLELISDSLAYEEILLSAISPWEFCKLIEKNKLAISCSAQEWLIDAFDIPKFRLVPLSPQISFKSTNLPGDFHSDPADQIIVASALKENAVLVTKDKRLLKYEYAQTIW